MRIFPVKFVRLPLRRSGKTQRQRKPHVAKRRSRKKTTGLVIESRTLRTTDVNPVGLSSFTSVAKKIHDRLRFVFAQIESRKCKTCTDRVPKKARHTIDPGRRQKRRFPSRLHRNRHSVKNEHSLFSVRLKSEISNQFVVNLPIDRLRYVQMYFKIKVLIFFH